MNPGFERSLDSLFMAADLEQPCSIRHQRGADPGQCSSRCRPFGAGAKPVDPCTDRGLDRRTLPPLHGFSRLAGSHLREEGGRCGYGPQDPDGRGCTPLQCNRKCQGIIACMDADARVDPNYLQALAEHFSLKHGWETLQDPRLGLARRLFHLF